jgi:hypothetical protein
MAIRLNIADDQFMTRSKNSTIWGRVYFENGDQFFPEQCWTDMVVAFSRAWLDALIRLATRSSRHEQVRFMDGPFQIDMSAGSKNVLELNLIHKDAAEQSAKATIEELLQNALSISNALLGICQQRGWPEDDFETKALANTTKQGTAVLANLKA